MKTKEETFEDYLKNRHAQVYQGLDDEMSDDYDKWFTELQIDDVIQYANEHTEILLSQQKREMVKEIEPVIEEMEEVIKAQEEGLGYDAKRLKKWIIEWKNQLKQKLTK